MKHLKKLTSSGLRDLAKDIKLPGYSRMSKEELENSLATKIKNEKLDVDYKKYKQLQEPSSSKSSDAKKETVTSKVLIVPKAKRRSIIPARFGRR